jgi:hypothetical protein
VAESRPPLRRMIARMAKDRSETDDYRLTADDTD